MPKFLIGRHKWFIIIAAAFFVTLLIGLFIYNIVSRDPRQVALYTAPDAVKAVAISPNQTQIVAGDVNGKITIWQREDGRHIQTWLAAETQITELRFSPDGSTLIVASADGMVRLWSSSAHQLLQTFSQSNHIHQSEVGSSRTMQGIPLSGAHAVALSADGHLIAIGGQQGTVNIFDANTGLLLYKLRGHAIIDNPGYYAGVVVVQV